MELKNKKLLVIGGAGFIGSHTVDELLKEPVSEIRIFDNFTRGRKNNLKSAIQDSRVKVFAHGGELLHPELVKSALEGIDGVFHFAALWLLHCWDYPRSAFEVNCGGLFNVLEAIVDNPDVQRLVWSSSASVYGDAVTEPMQESHPLNNTNFYGATKVAGEQFCRAYYYRYLNTPQEFDFVGLRYMNVYGARQDYKGAYIAVIMKILDRLEKGLPPVIYGDGSQAYDFVNVVDCARANIAAMKANVADEFYNVGTGIKTTIKELVDLILEITESDLTPIFEPSGQTFVKNRIGCPVKAEREIGYKHSVQLRDGLKDLIKWRNNHKSEVIHRRNAAE
ncbi:MAG: NAD-dependent epimerase/dehydratase family protein [Opitutae bacterium]|jgi:UDP-glucose 4-epimerase|nr:NAD-dependent epimerase/dehydratase family protein [Opitutae bacterium]MBT6462386.1 NAD-dependent epimerase/dehydratase family protein [Opitutae bacterium]